MKWALNIFFNVCFLTKIHFEWCLIKINEKIKLKKNLSKKTRIKVRGEGQRSMVKDHNFALFNFGTLPLLVSKPPFSSQIFLFFILKHTCGDISYVKNIHGMFSPIVHLTNCLFYNNKGLKPTNEILFFPDSGSISLLTMSMWIKGSSSTSWTWARPGTCSPLASLL